MILGLIEAVVLSLLYSIIDGLGLIVAVALSEALLICDGIIIEGLGLIEIVILSEALLLREAMRDADGVTDIEGEVTEHVKQPSV